MLYIEVTSTIFPRLDITHRPRSEENSSNNSLPILKLFSEKEKNVISVALLAPVNGNGRNKS